MVFAVRPKKYQNRHATPAAKTSINDLPVELMLPIVGLLATQDALNLKLACKSALPVCNTVLSERCKTLYLHPSKNALNMAMEICAHPIFNQTIETVILLGKPLLAEIGGSNTKRDGRASGETSDRLQHVQYHAWPSCIHSHPKLDSNNEPIDYIPTTHHAIKFANAFKHLIEALHKLPRLKSIKFSESPGKQDEGASLNRVALQTMSAHAQKIALPSQKMLKLVKPTPENPEYTCSDAEFLVRLFRELQCTSFSMESQLNFMDVPVSREIFYGQIDGTDPFSRLTHLEITLDVGWADQSISNAYQGMVESASATLHSLKIGFIPNASTEFSAARTSRCAQKLGRVLENIFPQGLQLKLQRLELDYPRLISPNARVHRPLCLAFDPLCLLYNLRTTLTKLTISNIILTSFDPQTSFHALALPYTLPLATSWSWTSHHQTASVTTQVILRVLNDYLSPSLENVIWQIPRFRHHPKCKEDDSNSAPRGHGRWDCAHWRCGRYDDLDSSVGVGRTMFEGVAGRLGVRVDEEGVGWDFGAVVRKGSLREEEVGS